jgi:hypothetical protein
MATEWRGLVLTATTSVGLAAIVFACLPGPWPNPLPEGRMDPGEAVRRLLPAAAVVDAACAAGDPDAFAEATTESLRRRLRRGIAACGQQLDADCLRAMGAASPLARWFERPALAGEVRGGQAAIAWLRQTGDGAQVLSFQWDGKRLRFDGSHHEVGVRDRDAARAAVAEAVASRSAAK